MKKKKILHLRNYMNGKLENKELTVIIERCSKGFISSFISNSYLNCFEKKIQPLKTTQ